jgi:hypothetical protein
MSWLVVLVAKSGTTRWATLEDAQATRPALTDRGTLDRCLFATWTNLEGTADIFCWVCGVRWGGVEVRVRQQRELGFVELAK